VIRLDTKGNRFVDGKEAHGSIAGDENLALMDSVDFAHLCRQLFESAFAASGAELKITQAGRVLIFRFNCPADSTPKCITLLN